MAHSTSMISGFSQPWPEHMRPKDAAVYLGTSKAFLDQARCNGSGPPFVRLSRTMVLYRRVDLDGWLVARRVSSTAEADRAGPP
jgi:hypothetical protein